jgi:glycosyltransferase involved in cell wall biosynthesis
MAVFHIVTDTFFPTSGGLENHILRVARHLLTQAGSIVVVHVCSSSHGYENDRDDPRLEGIIVSPIGVRRQSVLKPILGGLANDPERLVAERTRLDCLLLRGAIQKSLSAHPQDTHVILSFFISNAGFLAQQAAICLSLSHIACVCGSDYSRDLFNPAKFAVVEYVARRADIIVTLNSEQAHFLQHAFGPVNQIVTIPISLPAETLDRNWSPPPGPGIHLVSDSEYFYKKGTHLLLKTFSVLHNEGLPIQLSIVGRLDSLNPQYWTNLKTQYAKTFGSCVRLRSHVSSEEVTELLLSGHIYCSATLGEGCSHARAAALTLGMPIASTRCGELADLASDVPHVKLAPPGDQPGYTTALRELCRMYQTGFPEIDPRRVANWKAFFRLEREQTNWTDLVGALPKTGAA